MTAIMQLICQGETLANRQSRFPSDDPLTEASLKQVHQLKECVGPFTKIWTAPALAARQTQRELGLCGEPVPELAEPGYGRWAGIPIKTVIEQDEGAFQRWFSGEAPPGGESMAQVMARTGTWLPQRVAERECQCAIVSSAVIRAIVIQLLDAPVSAFQLIDILPLSVTTLRSNGKRWHLSCLGGRLEVLRREPT
jgi:broad specificity phosphatase PhoE